MNNDKFQDMATLSTLAQLLHSKMLNETDQISLLTQMKTDWGKQTFNDVVNNKLKENDRLLLIRYFSIFEKY